MNAIVRTRYGPPDVLHRAELPTPEPGPGEVRVRVRATSVNYGDLTARDFPALGLADFHMPAPLFYAARLSFGWSRPRNPVLGSEYAGEVDAVGAGVTVFATGDRVVGYRGQRMGAYADFLIEEAEGMLTHLSDDISYVDAGAQPYGGITALALLDAAGLADGERVLINGASGSIGMAALQIAVARGCTVTGVAGPANQELVRDLGATHALDYTKHDATDPAAHAGRPFDLVVDVFGRLGFDRTRRVLAPTGRYLPVSFKTPILLSALRTRRSRGQRVVVALAPERPELLRRVAAMMAEGTLRASISRVFPLTEAAAAHRWVEAGHKSGQVVLTA